MFSATFLGLLKNLTNKLDFGNWNYAVWIRYYLTSESFTFFYWDMHYKWKFIFFIYSKPYQNQVTLIHLLFNKPCPGKSLQFLQQMSQAGREDHTLLLSFYQFPNIFSLH